MKSHRTAILLLALVGYGVSVRAQNPGSLDLSFDPGTGANGRVYTTALQPDGKIIIGGNFTSYDGTASNCIARLNADGTLDNSFNVGTGASTVGTGPGTVVRTAAIQPDGKIIIGGQFNSYDGTAVSSIARLNADGTRDSSFSVGTGTNGEVISITVQPDGKIIIGGSFPSYSGIAVNNIARLNSDGTMDSAFTLGSGANSRVQTTAMQPDGKVIIGGWFTSYNGITQNRLARLNADGTLDGSFSAGAGPNNIVQTIAIQLDGKIIIAGYFLAFDGTARNHIARLNSDGTLDNSFAAGMGTNAVVNTTATHPDGKVIIGGDFNSYGGTARSHIACLNSDGSLDGSFTVGTGTDSYILTNSVQPDGGIIIGGNFTSYNGTSRSRIARLHGEVTSGVEGMDSSVFSIFPNPASSSVTILMPESAPRTKVVLRNLLGQEMLRVSVTTGRNEIALNGLAKGVYAVRVGNEVRRLVVE